MTVKANYGSHDATHDAEQLTVLQGETPVDPGDIHAVQQLAKANYGSLEAMYEADTADAYAEMLGDPVDKQVRNTAVEGV